MAKKKFKNVIEMVRELGDKQFADDFERQECDRRLINKLFALRAARGLSQSDIAAKLECTQSRISKMEASKDQDLRFGDIIDYANALGFGVTLQLLKRDATLIDRIKFHVFSIKRLLEKLVALCSGDGEMEKAGNRFVGELNFNMLNIVLDAHSRILGRPVHSISRVCIEVCEEDMSGEPQANRDEITVG